MKTERGIFEEYLFSTDKFKFRNKVFLFMLDENGEYEDIPVLEHWNTWQASANREGYKLVPVDAGNIMLKNGCTAISYGLTNEQNCERIYKAMIGAVE